MANGKPKYVEPTDYFPKETRKKFKLGEFSEKYAKKETTSKKKKTTK